MSNRTTRRTDAVAAARRRAVWQPALLFVLVREIGIVVLRFATDRWDGSLHVVLGEWDGLWFTGIAQHGYRGLPETFVDGHGVHLSTTALAFFPGYPGLVGALSYLPGVTSVGVALAISFVSAAVAAVGLHRLTTKVTGSTRAGLVLVALWSGAPMAITYSMAYSEALFVALVAWALCAVVERRWLLAGVLTLAAGLVRSSAVALIVAVVVVAMVEVVRRRDRAPLAAVLLAPLGLLAWLAVVAQRTGHLDGWFRIQRDGWDSHFDFGVATAQFIGRSLTDHNGAMDTVTAIGLLLAIAIVLFAIWRGLALPVLLYGSLTVALVLVADGTMSSKLRLLLPAAPLFIPIAALLAKRVPTWAMVAAVAAWIAFGAWFSAYSLTGWKYAI